MGRGTANPTFQFGIYFSPTLHSLEDPSILYDWPFGSFGVGSREFILQSIKDGVENAITEYLKANFDL